MDQESNPGVSVQGDVTQLGYTADGDVVLQVATMPPPKEVGIPCRVKGCGALNWAHAPVCRGCGKDRRPWRRRAYRALVVALLLTIVAIQLGALQRIS